MTTGPENPPPAAWQNLADSLPGSFTARARGLLKPEITLLTPAGEPFGSLKPDGSAGATLTAGEAQASIEGTDGPGHEMTSGGARLLTSHPKNSATTLEIRTPDQTYTAHLSLLRNRATAQTPEGHTAARIAGGLSNRRHGATFNPYDPNALPLALFLLYRLVVLRSTAYRTR